jgi:outer membrane protein TolC
LSFNIFDGGIKKRSLQIAKIQEEIGTIEIKEMKHSLENQLASLYEYYGVRKQILDVSNEAIKAAKLNLEISEQKFKNGTLNSFNYRDVQTMYLSTAINNLNAIYNLIDSKVQLMRISGGIISEYNPE